MRMLTNRENRGIILLQAFHLFNKLFISSIVAYPGDTELEVGTCSLVCQHCQEVGVFSVIGGDEDEI